jgi:hypothetical protein
MCYIQGQHGSFLGGLIAHPLVERLAWYVSFGLFFTYLALLIRVGRSMLRKNGRIF